MARKKVDFILFPSSFFDITKVDEDMRKEYDAALATGLFELALFGYDKWFNEDKLVVRNAPEEENLAVYRGWMMKPDQYERFYHLLLLIATICRNSGQGNYTPEPPKELIEKYKNLASPYYTVDYAELEDGTWRIVEAGDGEVSGLSDNQDYEHYFRALYQCFK